MAMYFLFVDCTHNLQLAYSDDNFIQHHVDK